MTHNQRVEMAAHHEHAHRHALDALRTFFTCLVWWGWISLFGTVGDRLEDTQLDFMGALHRLGWVGALLGVLLGYGVATFLAVVCFRMMGRAPSHQSAR